MKQFLIVVAVFLTLSASVLGQWRENGKVVPDTPWAKSDGTFGAELIFTDKPEELYAAWGKPGLAVHTRETSTAVRGIPIVGAVIFTGCVADAAGKCSLVGRYTTTTPSGKAYGQPIDADLWVGLPPPRGRVGRCWAGALGVRPPRLKQALDLQSYRIGGAS